MVDGFEVQAEAAGQGLRSVPTVLEAEIVVRKAARLQEHVPYVGGISATFPARVDHGTYRLEADRDLVFREWEDQNLAQSLHSLAKAVRGDDVLEARVLVRADHPSHFLERVCGPLRVLETLVVRIVLGPAPDHGSTY